MVIGTAGGYYLLQMSLPASILLASLFASHTLIAYPIVSKLGVAKHRAVNIAVGGTMITDVLALLVLAVIVGMNQGKVNDEFWIRLGVSFTLFALIVMFVFPLIARWFFKNFSDNVSQYIFVLAMVFLGSFLAEAAGIEAIIGAFLSGLALNRLIPHTSALMNRIEFVGNALFIPIFLISVGMLIDFKVFFGDWRTIGVAMFMSVAATLAKFIAAYLTQKTFRFSIDERRLIFGLSNAQAAATLAAVLVGYKLKIFDESILNGTILMILVTCTVASFVAQKGAQNIAIQEAEEQDVSSSDVIDERILIPINNVALAEDMMDLSVTLKTKGNKNKLLVMNVLEGYDVALEKKAEKILEKAAKVGSATDNEVEGITRFDLNVVNGISSVVHEQKVTDIIIGLRQKDSFIETFFSDITAEILARCNATTFIYSPSQPISTVKRYLIIVPDRAEREAGFLLWLVKIWNLARNTGAKLVFYSTESTLAIIKEIQQKHPVECQFVNFDNWQEFLVLMRDVQTNDAVVTVLGRVETPSYHPIMEKVPFYLNKYVPHNNYLLIYPIQIGIGEEPGVFKSNPSLLETLGKLDDVGKAITKLFKRK
jgi:Kef-type K+ transport system membrane component KefB